MEHIGTTPNKYMAIFWFVFAGFVAMESITVLWTPFKNLIIGLLWISTIFIVMGLQRTQKYRFKDEKIEKILRSISLIGAISTAFSFPIYMTLNL